METYLCAVQSDVEQKNTVKNLFIGKFFLWQEVGQTCFIAILSYGMQVIIMRFLPFSLQAMVILIAERCNIKIQAAKDIYDHEDSKTLVSLAMQSRGHASS